MMEYGATVVESYFALIVVHFGERDGFISIAWPAGGQIRRFQ